MLIFKSCLGLWVNRSIRRLVSGLSSVLSLSYRKIWYLLDHDIIKSTHDARKTKKNALLSISLSRCLAPWSIRWDSALICNSLAMRRLGQATSWRHWWTGTISGILYLGCISFSPRERVGTPILTSDSKWILPFIAIKATDVLALFFCVCSSQLGCEGLEWCVTGIQNCQ